MRSMDACEVLDADMVDGMTSRNSLTNNKREGEISSKEGTNTKRCL